MKISAVLRALVVMGLASLAGGAQAADTLAKIGAANKISLAYRESSVPFSYLNGPEKPIGFSVEIANAVAAEVKKRLNKPNLEVGLMAVTSQNRIPLITNGTIDLECGSTTNNTTRAKDVSFAVNHFYTGTRLLVKKASGVKDYADLKGKKVAITAGTTNMQVVRKYNEEKKLDIDIISAKDHADALLLVESDRADAFAMDDILLFGLRSNSKSPGPGSRWRIAAGRTLCLHAAEGRSAVQGAGRRCHHRDDEVGRIREALRQVVRAADPAEEPADRPADEPSIAGQHQGAERQTGHVKPPLEICILVIYI